MSRWRISHHERCDAVVMHSGPQCEKRCAHRMVLEAGGRRLCRRHSDLAVPAIAEVWDEIARLRGKLRSLRKGGRRKAS